MVGRCLVVTGIIFVLEKAWTLLTKTAAAAAISAFRLLLRLDIEGLDMILVAQWLRTRRERAKEDTNNHPFELCTPIYFFVWSIARRVAGLHLVQVGTSERWEVFENTYVVYADATNRNGGRQTSPSRVSYSSLSATLMTPLPRRGGVFLLYMYHHLCPMLTFRLEAQLWLATELTTPLRSAITCNSAHNLSPKREEDDDTSSLRESLLA